VKPGGERLAASPHSRAPADDKAPGLAAGCLPLPLAVYGSGAIKRRSAGRADGWIGGVEAGHKQMRGCMAAEQRAGCLYSSDGGLEWRTAAQTGRVHVGVGVSPGILWGYAGATTPRSCPVRAKPGVHARRSGPSMAAARVSGPLSTRRKRCLFLETSRLGLCCSCALNTAVP
jgi:hypothetical protein